MTTTNVNNNGKSVLHLNTNELSSGKYILKATYNQNEIYNSCIDSTTFEANSYVISDDCTTLNHWKSTSSNNNHITLESIDDVNSVSINRETWDIGYWRVPINIEHYSKIEWKFRKNSISGSNFTFGFYSLYDAQPHDQRFLPILKYTNLINKYEIVREDSTQSNNWDAINTTVNAGLSDNTWINCEATILNRNINITINNRNFSINIPTFSNDELMNNYVWFGADNVTNTPIMFKDIVLTSSIEYDENVASYLEDKYFNGN